MYETRICGFEAELTAVEGEGLGVGVTFFIEVAWTPRNCEMHT